MPRTFAGLVPVGEDEILDVVLSVDDVSVELKAKSGSIGQWTRADVDISYAGKNAFVLKADGEALPFSPRDFYSFKDTVDRLFPTLERRRRPRLAVAGSLIAVVSAAAIIANATVSQAGTPVQITTTFPAPAVVVASSEPGAVSEARLPVDDFVAAWNAAAHGRPQLIIETLSGTHEITPQLRLMVTAPGGAVEVVRILASPTGDNAHDRLVLAAVGAAIAAADPTLDASARRTLVEELGWELDRPMVHDIAGSAERNGLTYRLTYGSGRLTFAITIDG